jgi:hypothetical protein
MSECDNCCYSLMRVTRKTIDPITFSSHLNMSSKLEDDSLMDESWYQGMADMDFLGSSDSSSLSLSSCSVSLSSQKHEKKSKTQKSSKKKKILVQKRRRFSNDVEVFIIPRFEEEDYDKLFYAEDEIKNFRHEAFLEGAGLSSEDFDFDYNATDDSSISTDT